jgi:hypothetical protein
VYIHGRLSEQIISGAKAAFETTFRVTGGYSKARTNFPKRVTGRIFTDNMQFHRSKQKNVKTISAKRDF